MSEIGSQRSEIRHDTCYSYGPFDAEPLTSDSDL
jgi:hypothetical protein